MSPTSAQEFLRRARQSLNGAVAARDRGDLEKAVSDSQETVELSTKGALALVGSATGKQHDTAEILRARVRKFPSAYRTRVEGWARASSRLEEVREASVYPDADVAPDLRQRLADPVAVGRTVEEAKTVFDEVSELLRDAGMGSTRSAGKLGRRGRV